MTTLRAVLSRCLSRQRATRPLTLPCTSSISAVYTLQSRTVCRRPPLSSPCDTHNNHRHHERAASPFILSSLSPSSLSPVSSLSFPSSVSSPFSSSVSSPFSSSVSSPFSSSVSSLSPASARVASSSSSSSASTALSVSSKSSPVSSLRAFSTFSYQDVFYQPNPVDVEYEEILDLKDKVKIVKIRSDPAEGVDDEILLVDPSVLSSLAERAFFQICHFLRPSHLAQLRKILDDSSSSKNDRFVALELLKNANIAAGRVLPGCQDTGTAIVMAKKGQHVFTQPLHGQKENAMVDDYEALSLGVYTAYQKNNLRYSQVAPYDMFNEKNTKTNLPAQIDILTHPNAHGKNHSFDFLFIAKGGGSANKTFLYQQTKALLNHDNLYNFLEKNIKTIGTSACPPYHLAIVIGGLSAEMTLKTVKLASCRYLDGLPTKGNDNGTAFRDLEWEDKILQMCQKIGIGAQFGGKYFCHDVRVIRLPRHGASCPVGIGVSCSADRQVLAKINKNGVFIEKLEENPAHYLPETEDSDLGDEAIEINLNRPMDDILDELSKYKIKQRLSLTGSLVVARDIAHSKLMERLKSGGKMPQYMKDHPIYYAGPAKTPKGFSSGSFGPTTAGRMDGYVEEFMKNGASKITLAKGNRSKDVVNACKKYKGFYLGSIGGPAAILAKNCIKKVEVLEFEELGMEAIWKIDVEKFPAFIVVDDKGHDFFKEWLG